MIRRLLHTTADFDTAITDFATRIINKLKDEADPDDEFDFYLYQDFSSSLTLNTNKDLIVKARLSKSDLAGFAEPEHRLHFMRSKMYAKMADERTLRYFNKIIFKT